MKTVPPQKHRKISANVFRAKPGNPQARQRKLEGDSVFT